MLSYQHLFFMGGGVLGWGGYPYLGCWGWVLPW